MSRPFSSGVEAPGSEQFFQWPLLLVLLNRLVAAAAAAGSLVASGCWGDLRPAAPLWAYALVSASNVAASRCQYAALRHLSFPAQALGKSAKVGPALLWGRLMANRSYSLRDIISAMMTFGGCALFFLAGGPSSRAVTAGLPGSSSTRGLLLLAAYLGIDGFTGAFQERLYFLARRKSQGMRAQNQVLWVSLCSAVGSAGALALWGELLPALRFLARNPAAAAAATALSASSTAAQFGIAATLRAHGALALATILSARQPLAVTLSCALFAHAPAPPQLLGAALASAPLLLPRAAPGPARPARPRPRPAPNTQLPAEKRKKRPKTEKKRPKRRKPAGRKGPGKRK